MRLFSCVLLGLCLWNCATQNSSLKSGANSSSTVTTSNVVADDNQIGYPKNIVKNPTDNRKNRGSFRVDAFIDDKLVSRSFYRKGLCTKYITFNTETKRQESEVEYLYDNSGELSRTKVKQGAALSDVELLAEKSYKDFMVQYSILQSKGIELPLPDIAADEVSDISNILSVADNYSDFKMETQNDGNRKT